MVNRRDLLTGGALLAAGLTMAACTPGATTIRPQPSGRPTMPTNTPRTLVAFFSRAGENHYYGGRTWLDVGNTEVVVGHLSSLVDVDVYRIVPADPYPTDYEETVAQNAREQASDSRPRITNPLPDLARYDRVVLASGIWNLQPPMIMRTFTEALDFVGITIHPLTTHAGSGLGQAPEIYRLTCPGATLADGLSIRGEEAEDSEPLVRTWLQRIGLQV